MWGSVFGSSAAMPATSDDPRAHEVTFKLNGKTVTVGSEVSDTASLNSYIRDVAKLTGTKFMCYEGGCGVCVVAVNAEHPVTKMRTTFAVNSCLVPVLACHGWEVTTTEGLGDKRSGYHQVQATLAGFNGTQCGFCSPGMVMNMHSLMKDKIPTMAEVENAFGGNLCRCTGYRPILDAFKSLASDATPSMKKACADIEDLYKICSKTGKACSGSCKKKDNDFEKVDPLTNSVHVKLPSSNWYKVSTVAELFSVLNSIGSSPYKLVAGNTGEGVFRSSGITVRIDVKDVVELRTITAPPSLTLGGNVTLTEAIQVFNSATAPEFTYLKKLAEHIDHVANRPVRNIGTLAGNLMLKRQHPEFPSDLFVMFETVGATLNIMSSGGGTINVTLMDFLTLDMNKRIILNIAFPSLDSTYHLRTFKISRRAQNSHAHVSAGFLVKVANTTDWLVTQQPRIVISGINPTFNHATNTEQFLNGRNLLAAATISGALAALSAELVPDWVLPDADPAYRKPLAQALFYKFLLGLDSTKVTPNKRTGADNLIRPLSSGIQEYDTDESIWPLNKPIPKLEAIAQTSGEAEYTNDIPVRHDELHAIFVLTTVATGTIARIDPSPALDMDGVLAFYSATDIPGNNNFTPTSLFLFNEIEEIFCSGMVKYAGQVVGMIVAETRTAAMAGAGAVVIEYAKVQKPFVNIEQVVEATGGRTRKVEPAKQQNAAVKKTKAVVHTITGRFELSKQYHLHMETQACLVVPTEDGFDIFSACQWMDQLQQAVSQALLVPENSINVVVRRLGGGYGGKISRPSQLAAACAVAAHKLGRPVRMVMTLSSNMEVMGKRYALRNDYEVGVDADGKIEYLNTDILSDTGCYFNEIPVEECLRAIPNCYINAGFNVNYNMVRTDTASNISCRAPGTTEGVAFIEEIMEHIAHVTGLDPLQVRLNNMTQQDNPLPGMITELKQKADYDNRAAAVVAFNNANRWKKRGIALVPLQYPFPIWGNFSALVSIFHGDGTVAVTHGGIEMGQGINTKVAQVTAHILGIPLEMVSVKPSASLTAPNGMVTGGSIGSEAASYAAMKACEDLLRKLEPVRAGMQNPTWLQLIEEAFIQNIDLCSTYMFTDKDSVSQYNIWGVSAAEVEIDVLTGEKQILRVDILEDTGRSLSPLVDIGQIEGAFVMGIGYWLTEEISHDPITGRLLNADTWNYKPPGAKDIPVDFRVYFRKNAPNLVGVLSSKATGEPALNMSIVVLFAVRNALNSARKDAGASVDYYQMKTPATNENIYLASLTDPSQFQL